MAPPPSGPFSSGLTSAIASRTAFWPCPCASSPAWSSKNCATKPKNSPARIDELQTLVEDRSRADQVAEKRAESAQKEIQRPPPHPHSNRCRAGRRAAGRRDYRRNSEEAVRGRIHPKRLRAAVFAQSLQPPAGQSQNQPAALMKLTMSPSKLSSLTRLKRFWS